VVSPAFQYVFEVAQCDQLGSIHFRIHRSNGQLEALLTLLIADVAAAVAGDRRCC